VRIHIHSPSEHLLDKDQPFDYECHLVHFQASDTAMAGPKVVIGVFFHKVKGATTPDSIKRLNKKLGERSAKGVKGRWQRGEEALDNTVNPTHFLPSDARDRSRWFHYEGSLTSGTYSEDVSWFVMQREIPVNPSDTEELDVHARRPARPIFWLNRRFVLRSF